MKEVIAFTDVVVKRSTSTLVGPVSWTVREGERWVVLGPNGAGKTTLLQIAAAMCHPTTGKATVLGGQLGSTDVFELRPRIGLSSVAVAARVPPKERVVDVVVTAARAVVGRGSEHYDRVDLNRAYELLTALGIGRIAVRPYGTLSEGERKRVEVARALMTDPELLLLDEPAAGLDLAGREELVRRLSVFALDSASPTMVLVTHHVEEIPPGFSHALLMREGHIVAQGPLRDVITADNLSRTFALPVHVRHYDGRWAAWGEPVTTSPAQQVAASA